MFIPLEFAEEGAVPKTRLHSLAFESPPPKYSAEAVLKLLLDPSIDRSRVCTTWLVGNITGNASFIVDITSLKHPDDVRKDFFSRWTHSGSHPFAFTASIEAGELVRVEKCAPGATGNVFYLHRLHLPLPHTCTKLELTNSWSWKGRATGGRMLAFVSGKL